MNLSGAAHDKAARPGYYARMVGESMGKGDTTSEEIERDLHRSLPEHKAFQRPKSSDAFSAQSAAGLETNAICFLFASLYRGYCFLPFFFANE